MRKVMSISWPRPITPRHKKRGAPDFSSAPRRCGGWTEILMTAALAFTIAAIAAVAAGWRRDWTLKRLRRRSHALRHGLGRHPLRHRSRSVALRFRHRPLHVRLR